MKLPEIFKRRGVSPSSSALPAGRAADPPSRAEPVLALAGIEAPIGDRADDLLDRYAVARALHRSIATAPAGWSTRIGLYAPWGSGKTSVLRLLAQLERQRGSVVVEFSAWSASGEGGILTLFYATLVEQLQKNGVDVEPLKAWGKRVAERAAKRLAGAGNALSQAGAYAETDYGAMVSGAGMAASFAGSVVSDWMQFTPEDLRSLQRALGSRQVVVFIDDIDRSDPRAVPKTLLALRELLNWPGFAFVLAFDKEIVGKAIAEYSKAYGDSAERFLEKVVDIPFDLPDPTAEQAARLARRALDECCPFIPADARAQVAKWLPANPRRSKLTARKLGVLRDIADRHDPHELDWHALGLQTVLRVAHPQLAAFVEDGFLGMGSGAWASFLKDKDDSESASALDKGMPAVLSGVSSPQEKRWLMDLARALVSARRVTPEHKIAYEMGLLYQEPVITWKEFRGLLERWQEGVTSAVALEIEAAATRSLATREASAEGIVRLALEHYRRALDAAAETSRRASHSHAVDTARRHLAFLEHLHGDAMPSEVVACVRSADHVKALYEALLEWAHFTANEQDAQLRRLETALMHTAAAKCDDKLDFYMSTKPARIHKDPWGGSDGAAREAFKDAARKVVAGDVVDAAVGWFHLPDGVASAIRGELAEESHWLLGAPESPLYRDSGSVSRLVRSIEAISDLPMGSERALAIDGVRLYLVLLLGSMPGVSWVSPEDTKKFFQTHPVIAATGWQVLTSEEAQFRALHGLRELRQALQRAGVDESVLQQPPWLLAT
jgi:hypothetical protein